MYDEKVFIKYQALYEGMDQKNHIAHQICIFETGSWGSLNFFKNFICRTNDIHIENISSKLLVLNICYLTYQLWNAVKCLSATFEMAPSFFNIDGKPIYRFIGHLNLDAHIKCLSIASLITRGTGIRVPSSTDFQSHMTFFGTHLCTRIITKNLGHLNFGHQITNKKSVWTMLDSNYRQKICKI